MDRSALARYLVTEADLRQQLEREYLPTGITVIDTELGGVPRGSVTEIWGPATSGKTTFINNFLARSTGAGEFCALIDASDTFDPASASAASADLSRLLWVRCHGAEHALKAADLLTHSGGWGLIVMDLSDLPPAVVRRIPMTWWYRFRRAVERTPTVFVIVEREPFVKNCATMALEFPPAPAIWSGAHSRFRILRGTRVHITPRKPVHSRGNNLTYFESRAPEIA
ncbi:MAG: hypothetical protein H7039_10660 [Bryobacteraceae bacterium]|nr:hypothetical protein [Bryobacteraceae bacterium]